MTNLNSPTINIRYVTDYPKCNYSCVYCIAGHGEVTKGRERFWDEKRYKAILGNIAKVPHNVNVRLGVAGEFFLDKELVDGAAILSHSANVVSVNLITNLSFKYHQYQKKLERYDHSKVAIVASFHPSEIEDVDHWLSVATRMANDHELSVVMVAFPPLLKDLKKNHELLTSKGLDVFIQPFIGAWDGKMYPQSYSSEEDELIKSIMYSRHDYEFLMKLKKPGLCNAGYTSLYVNPKGVVYPCGMGGYKDEIGNFSIGHELKLRVAANPCPFSQCQCDTENMNTVQFSQYYEFESTNQHKYNYRFADAALLDDRVDEWSIAY